MKNVCNYCEITYLYGPPDFSLVSPEVSLSGPDFSLFCCQGEVTSPYFFRVWWPLLLLQFFWGKTPSWSPFSKILSIFSDLSESWAREVLEGPVNCQVSWPCGLTGHGFLSLPLPPRHKDSTSLCALSVCWSLKKFLLRKQETLSLRDSK